MARLGRPDSISVKTQSAEFVDVFSDNSTFSDLSVILRKALFVVLNCPICFLTWGIVLLMLISITATSYMYKRSFLQTITYYISTIISHYIIAYRLQSDNSETTFSSS